MRSAWRASIGLGASIIAGVTFLIIAKYCSCVETRSEHRGDAQRSLKRVMGTYWDNLMLANGYTLTKWENSMSDKLHDFEVKSRKLAWTQFGVQFGLLSLVYLPTLAAFAWYIDYEYNTPGVLIEAAAIFTRIFSLLQTIVSLAQALSDSWLTLQIIAQQRAILAHHQTVLWPRNLGGIAKQIQWKPVPPNPLPDQVYHYRITFVFPVGQMQRNYPQHDGGDPEQELLEDIRQLKQQGGGIVTIRGPNFHGKSTILVYLKYSLQGSALYVPAHHRLAFLAPQNGSTGQNMVWFIYILYICDLISPPPP